MDNFRFYSPTRFVFGREAERQVARCVREAGGNKVLIHYGGGSVVRSGLLDRVKAVLTEAGIHWVELGGAQPNPRSGLVYEGIALCRRECVDLVLAVGGGSAIDSAKAIALGAVYEGDFWDFYSGKRPQNALPVGVILTLAATGSEASRSSVITHENGMLKRSCDDDWIRPKFAIMNPELLFTLPAYQTAAGCVDIFAHVFERYFTSSENVEVTDRICEALMKTVISQARRCIDVPDDYDARANILWAGTLAHNDICGVGRVQDWGCHCIEHELSALYDCAHGAGLAVVMPAWMKYNWNRAPERFAQFAERVFDCEGSDRAELARQGAVKLTEFFRSLDMPVTFAELGAREEDIPKLAKKVAYGPNGTTGNAFPLDEKQVEDVLKLAVKG